MRKSMQLLSCLAVIALPVISMPAHAQENGPPPGTVMMQPPQGGPVAAPDQMHAEHDQLEQLRTEHARLKAQCMNAIGPDLADCHQRMKEIHHQMRALKTQMGMPSKHHKGDAAAGGQWPRGPEAAPAGGAPAMASPAPSEAPQGSGPSQMPGGQ